MAYKPRVQSPLGSRQQRGPQNNNESNVYTAFSGYQVPLSGFTLSHYLVYSAQEVGTLWLPGYT